jgi:hypothetical protein
MAFFVEAVAGGDALPLPLQQGDIIARAPFVAVSLESATLVIEDGDEKRFESRDLTAADLHEDAWLAAKFALLPAIIVSQSCDLERGEKPIILAPIRPLLSENPNMQIGSKKFLERLEALGNPGRQPAFFPIPPGKAGDFELPYSLVYLAEMQSFASPNRPAIERLARCRLSADALGKLQERLSFFFGRFAAPDGLFLDPNHQ